MAGPHERAPGAGRSGATLIKYRYELQTQLADGPVLDTWRALDRTHQDLVIVKLVRPRYAVDEKACRRWMQQLARQRGNPLPAGAEVLDVGRDGETWYLVRELVPGLSLERWINQERGVDDHLACFEAVLRALAEWHEGGLCHGQLHPGNVILQESGPVFCDWDLAAQTLNCLGVFPARRKHRVYLAPEVRDSYNATPGSDVYSLGVALWEALTGRRLALEVEVPPPPSAYNPALPPELDVVVEGMLRREPDDRYPAAQAAEALAKLRPRAETRTEPTARGQRRQRARDRRELPRQPLPWPVTVILALYRFLFILFFTGLVSVGTIGVMGYGAYRYLVDSIPAEVIIPDVTGKSVDQARALFESDLGLGFTVTLKQASPTVPEGCIITTRPEAGRKVREGRTVEAIVSTGAELVTVPRLTEQSQAEAERAVERLGLKLGFVQQVPDATLQAGFVLRQNPGPGRKVPAGSTVSLKISAGPAAPTAPVTEEGTKAAGEAGQPAEAGGAGEAAKVQTRKVGRVKITVPSTPRLTWVKIVVRDDAGERTVYNELRYAGEVVLKAVEGAGANVVVEVYLNGTRVETKVL